MSITDLVHGTADAGCFCRTFGDFFFFRDGYFGKVLQMEGCWGNVDGIASHCGRGGPGFETRWGEISRTHPDEPRVPHNLMYNGYRVFFRG